MVTVCALYKFARLDDFEQMQQPLKDFMVSVDARGTILLAREGINGTVCGSQQAIEKILSFLAEDERLGAIDHKLSYTEEMPFKRLKVKLKKEIVTLGVADIDPTFSVGTYVPPSEWNDLISDPDVVLIDTRNNYEYEIGSFKGAINPDTESFCTGGIRCEKSTAYLKSQGFEEVYHLHGGILKYLEEVDEKDSLWDGECFVFDDRVAVKHNLEQGQYDQCHACRYPITDVDKGHEYYEKGVSCPRCFGSKDEAQVSRYREREKQMQLASARGEAHIGDDATQVLIRKSKNKSKA